MDIGLISLAETEDMALEIRDFDSLIETKSRYIIRYYDFSADFPGHHCEKIVALNKTPIICWMPDVGDNTRSCSVEDNGITKILNGEYDAYIKEFARKVKDFKHNIIIKFQHELNSDWYTWGGKKNTRDTKKVKSLWTYVVGIFRELQVKNVEWMWTVHEDSMRVSQEEWNDIQNYWPGDEWVDYIGIDGFNFYPDNPERQGAPFLSFYNCFNKMYTKVTQLSSRPVMVMTGSAEYHIDDPVPNKPEWVAAMFTDLKYHFKNITSVHWFNYKYSDEIDWRVNSSEESLNKWKKGLAES